MTLLAGEGTRSEIHGLLLSNELEHAEAETSWLRDALIDAAAVRVLNERAAEQRIAQATAETAAEHTSLEAVRQELEAGQARACMAGLGYRGVAQPQGWLSSTAPRLRTRCRPPRVFTTRR